MRAMRRGALSHNKSLILYFNSCSQYCSEPYRSLCDVREQHYHGQTSIFKSHNFVFIAITCAGKLVFLAVGPRPLMTVQRQYQATYARQFSCTHTLQTIDFSSFQQQAPGHEQRLSECSLSIIASSSHTSSSFQSFYLLQLVIFFWNKMASSLPCLRHQRTTFCQ